MKRPIFSSIHEACSYCGVLIGELPPAGSLFRLPTEKHPKTKNGFITAFPDGGAFIGNWENGLEAIFSNRANKRLTHRELEAIKLKSIQERINQESAERKKHLDIAQKVQDFFRYEGAIKTTDMEANGEPRHPYLVKKGVEPTETIYECTKSDIFDFFGDNYQRLPGGRLLVIPLLKNSTLVSMQLIDEQGGKYFLKNGTTKGAYWKATVMSLERGQDKKVHMAEGVATILSVLQNSPSRSGVFIACMNAGNIKPVAEYLTKRFSNTELIMWADRDQPQQGHAYGVGVEKAQQAQITISSLKILAPPFTEKDVSRFKELTGKVPTDWNDFYLIRGKG